MASWWAQACGSEVLGSRGKLKSLMALGLMTRWKAQGINALRIRKILYGWEHACEEMGIVRFFSACRRPALASK